MKTAKLYNQIGWWKFYRTDEGHGFTVRDNKDYWYNGNVNTGDRTGECYIPKEKHAELFARIKFE